MLICEVDMQKIQFEPDFYQKLSEVKNEENEYCILKDLSRTITGLPAFKLDPLSG